MNWGLGEYRERVSTPPSGVRCSSRWLPNYRIAVMRRNIDCSSASIRRFLLYLFLAQFGQVLDGPELRREIQCDEVALTGLDHLDQGPLKHGEGGQQILVAVVT